MLGVAGAIGQSAVAVPPTPAGAFTGAKAPVPRVVATQPATTTTGSNFIPPAGGTLAPGGVGGQLYPGAPLGGLLAPGNITGGQLTPGLAPGTVPPIPGATPATGFSNPGGTIPSSKVIVAGGTTTTPPGGALSGNGVGGKSQVIVTGGTASTTVVTPSSSTVIVTGGTGGALTNGGVGGTFATPPTLLR
jgi:hypothetical protein